MSRFKKIAFNANATISLDWALRILEDEECTEVYLIGANAQRRDSLAAAGLVVHEVPTKEELPADVFHWYQHEGKWGAVHTESGYIRDVGFAEDSLGAYRILTSTYAPNYREQFQVRPVEVKLLEGF